MKQILCALAVTVLALSSNSSLQAQNAERAWGLGIHPGIYSFYALRSDGAGLFQEAGGGVELSLNRYISKTFDLGLETGFARVRHPNDVNATLPSQRDNFITGNLAARFKLNNGSIMKEDAIVAPFIKAGFGVNSYTDLTDWVMFVPAGAGITFQLPKSPINLVVQGTYNVGIDRNDFLHFSAGLNVNFGKEPGRRKKLIEESKKAIELSEDISDRDYDKVPDDEDQCPDIYGSTLAAGCPDTDSDGVRDTEDECPEINGFANLKGCVDSDYDGIIDPLDKCPNEYGETAEGCPDISDPNDIDNDGVANAMDECPDVPGLFTASGCPDSDGDGIRDEIDECIDYYGVSEFGGCPLAKEELDRLKDIYGDPEDPDIMVVDGQLVDKNGNPVDNMGNVMTPNGYRSDRNDLRIITSDGTVIEIDESGNLVNNDGDPLTNTGGFTIDDKGNLVDRSGGVVRVDNAGNIIDGSGYTINNTTGDYVSTGGNPNNGGNYMGNGGNPNYPYNTGGTVYGGNPDPEGGNGGIAIGNPMSKQGKDVPLTGFTPYVKLSPEDEEYCQRLDLTSFRSAIYFDYDGSGLDNEAYQALSNVVEAMRRCAMFELQIAGHTDSDGGAGYNKELSEKRALAVIDYITGSGISDRRLKYNAYGEKYPIVPNNNDENKQTNRRAEIRIQRSY